MNQFIEQYEAMCTSITKDEEIELVEHILDNSIHTSIEDFAKSHINYFDALEIAQSDDYFASAALEYLDNRDLLPVKLPPLNKLAYNLVYDNPTEATNLLEELLYYRSLGRI